MKTVLVRGPVLTQSGYGVHSRQVARWLLNRPDLDVKFLTTPWGDTPWLIDLNSHDGLVGEIMKRTVGPKSKTPFDVSVQIQLPNEWDPSLGNVNVGITAAVETDRCNPEWVNHCNAMDKVIVPSNHVKQIINASGVVTKDIAVVPESFVDSISKDVHDVALPTFSTPFNFLVFGQLTGTNPHNDRKNTFFTIKWLCEVFKDHPDVGIVLKTNAGRNSKMDRDVVKNMMQALLADVRKGRGPKVHLLHGDLNDDEVAALYRHDQIKALVSLTRGEGYGLPILEAAASGLPVIATNWSGHLDFLRLGKFVSVSYQLGDVHPSRIDGQIFVKGSRWANPSEEDFKKRVLKFKDSNTVPREWAAALKTKLHETHTFEKIASTYDLVLKEII